MQAQWTQISGYKINGAFDVSHGFRCTAQHVANATVNTNSLLDTLPITLFGSIDYKTTSTIVGRMFADRLAKQTGAIVNPIEKGHPDLIPAEGSDASEAVLRNYPSGIEVKVTVGNVPKGSKLKHGSSRIAEITGITWQAHHKEVKVLLGVIWDFSGHAASKPIITASFFSDQLDQNDWGEISGTTGRNTKVTGMRASGRNKMGKGWIIILNDSRYLDCYENLLNFKT